jgi:ABC-type sulfate/molybdate transport systems ATPase subunit
MYKLEVQDLHKRYGSHEVLKGVSLAAAAGDVISIIGSSGSGKSTFLRCINLLEQPHAGKILLNNEELKLVANKDGADLSIGNLAYAPAHYLKQFHPNYADAAQQAAFVARRQELDRLYAEGVRLYDLGDWAGALARFEQIEQQGPGFRRDAVQEFLFVCYQ